MRPQSETRWSYKVVLLTMKVYWSFCTTHSSEILDPIYKCPVDHAQAFFGAVELKWFFLKRTWCYFGSSFWVFGGQYAMTWLHLGSEPS